MSSIEALSRRVKALEKLASVRTMYTFVLLGSDATIPPAKLARMRPGDTTYIKRILLCPGRPDNG